jgi:hypothetical protein
MSPELVELAYIVSSLFSSPSTGLQQSSSVWSDLARCVLRMLRQPLTVELLKVCRNNRTIVFFHYSIDIIYMPEL